MSPELTGCSSGLSGKCTPTQLLLRARDSGPSRAPPALRGPSIPVPGPLPGRLLEDAHSQQWAAGARRGRPRNVTDVQSSLQPAPSAPSLSLLFP